MNIQFMSQADAEKLEPTKTMALISICSPSANKRNFTGWRCMLTVDFDDIVAPIENWPEKIMFTPEMAERIIKFVNALPPDIDTIVVHCFQGISRSAAVAKYLCERFGEKFLPNWPDYPYCNKLVYKTLKEAKICEKCGGTMHLVPAQKKAEISKGTRDGHAIKGVNHSPNKTVCLYRCACGKEVTI